MVPARSTATSNNSPPISVMDIVGCDVLLLRVAKEYLFPSGGVFTSPDMGPYAWRRVV